MRIPIITDDEEWDNIQRILRACLAVSAPGLFMHDHVWGSALDVG